MSNFKRASLTGSEELFRPTRPRLVEEEVITEALDRKPEPAPSYLQVGLTREEVDLILESVQAAKYPEQNRSKPSLAKFERLDALKLRLQEIEG